MYFFFYELLEFYTNTIKQCKLIPYFRMTLNVPDSH